jgi:hypothetical protein
VVHACLIFIHGSVILEKLVTMFIYKQFVTYMQTVLKTEFVLFLSCAVMIFVSETL